MIAGIARMIRKDVTSIAQAKRGMRSSVMPGALCFRIVTTSSTATARAAISVNVTVWAQMSARLP